MSPLTKSHLMNSILINPTPECSRSSSPRSHDPRSAEPPYKTKGREHMTPGEHRWDDDRWGSNSDGPGMEDARPPQGPEQQPRSGDSRESSVTSDDGAQQNSAGTPSQRKKRKTQQYQKTSCELCKARKVKCDRAEPACGWCASHNRTCVYLERQKPGSRTGFNVELEAKVNRIDALLQSLGRRVEEHIAHDHPTPTVSEATPGAVPYRNSPQTIHNASSEFGQGPGPSSLGRATPMESARAATTPGGGVSDPFSRIDTSSERMAGLELQAPGSLPNHAYSPANTATPRSLSTIPDLPPQDMIYSLVDLYFKHCNTWCPILERQTIFGVFFGSTSLSEADRVLLHAIVATTLRFFKDPRLTPHMKAHYHATSRRIVQMYVMEHISIPALRALVIICLDELGTSNGPKGWNLLSLLTQNVKQLGLCEENSVYLLADADDVPRTGSMRRVVAGRPESWIEDEGRRRLAWMVYLLDRYATVATTTFDFMLGDQRMKRFLPCSYDLFSRNVPRETRQPSNVLEPADPNNYANVANNAAQLDSLGSFSYHCEILRIMSEVHNFLKTPLDVTSPSDMAGWRNKYQLLDAALDRWLQSLPSEYSRISALCHSDPASRVANWFMLHSAYVTAVIRLHSSAAYPTVRTEIFVPSHYAMQRCLSAVQSLRDISQDVYEADGLDLLGPPFAFSLWVAARLLLVHAATVGAPVDEKIEFFIETLGYVGQYWEVANNYARILKRVVQRGQQSDLSFSAMRRSAHDLVTLTGSARRSGLDPTSTQATSLSELDSIDVFDFFHYPKVADEAMTRNAFGQTNLLQPQTMDGRQPIRAVPDPDSDWLRMGSYQ